MLKASIAKLEYVVNCLWWRLNVSCVKQRNRPNVSFYGVGLLSKGSVDRTTLLELIAQLGTQLRCSFNPQVGVSQEHHLPSAHQTQWESVLYASCMHDAWLKALTVIRLISITDLIVPSSNPTGAHPQPLLCKPTTVSGAMLLAYLFLSAILAVTVGDRDISAENIASPYAHVKQAVESHFQLMASNDAGEGFCSC